MDFDPLLRWLREALTQNLGLKAVALIFALGFFGYVHGQENVQQRTIPVSVISLPPESGERELMTKIPPDIHITLRGSGRALTELVQNGAPPVEIDLRQGYPSEIKFDATMFRLPPQLELIVVDPPRLELEWEEVITRHIALQASITGQLAEGFILKGEPKVEPERVAVKGPRSRVEVIQFARLSPYNVTGLTEGRFPRRIAIDPPPDRVSYLGTPAATVVVEVKRREWEKLFSERVVQVVGPGIATVHPREVDVTVIGPPDVVRALRPDQIVPQADLLAAKAWNADSGPGAASVEVKVDLSKVRVEVQPPSVTVKWR
jgi:YbbR domain-containing protein